MCKEYDSMKHVVTLSNGVQAPALGQGTWHLGDVSERRAQEIAALRAGIDAGMTLIDTAEMYGNGRAERLVGEAIHPYDRSTLFLVSKVLPSNACGARFMQSLERSLSYLGTDYLDLYLYHWRGSDPLTEVVASMEAAKAQGKIRAWGARISILLIWRDSGVSRVARIVS